MDVLRCAMQTGVEGEGVGAGRGPGSGVRADNWLGGNNASLASPTVPDLGMRGEEHVRMATRLLVSPVLECQHGTSAERRGYQGHRFGVLHWQAHE